MIIKNKNVFIKHLNWAGHVYYLKDGLACLNHQELWKLEVFKGGKTRVNKRRKQFELFCKSKY